MYLLWEEEAREMRDTGERAGDFNPRSPLCVLARVGNRPRKEKSPGGEAGAFCAYRYRWEGNDRPRNQTELMGSKRERRNAMENVAHLFLIVGYSLMVLKHFVGL